MNRAVHLPTRAVNIAGATVRRHRKFQTVSFCEERRGLDAGFVAAFTTPP